MLYDVRLELTYDYDATVHGGRHLIRVAPITVPGVQRVVASSLSFEPRPQRESTFIDFFGNSATAITYVDPHDRLDIRLTARVQVEDIHPPADLSPTLLVLRQEIARFWSVEPDSPHHFLAQSPRVQLVPAITDDVQAAIAETPTVNAAATAHS